MQTSPLTITILGSGTSTGVPMIGCHCPVCSSDDPRDKRSRCSIVVAYHGQGADRQILVDTTPELRIQALANRIDRIDSVVFTHAHADHIFGLDDLRRYNAINHAPLPLYADAAALNIIQRAFAYAFEPHEKVPGALYRPELVPHPIAGPFDLFGKKWIPIPMIHGRLSVLGFRIGGFAYCTDCNEIPDSSREMLTSPEWGGPIDTLIIDGLRPTPHPTHLSFEQSVAMIEKLRPRRAFFTHVAHNMKHADIERDLPPHIRVLHDGLILTV